MHRVILLFCSIIVVTANVCENELLALGSPLVGSFGMPGDNEVYFLDIFEDQQKDLLYFVGYFTTAIPWTTIIYKSDLDLGKIKVMTYDIYSIYSSLAFDSSKDLIYIMDITTDKIFQIRTTDLMISKELSISTSSFNWNSNMEINKSLYFSVKISSVLHTCRWDTLSTNLGCFTFGVDSPTNLVPISEDILFFGSIDTSADQYYLVNYNFSDPSNLVWKKSIACPTSGCESKISSAILSQDKEWIYTMILFDKHYIFHKICVSDGTPENSGFIWNKNGYYLSYSIKEYSEFIAIQLEFIDPVSYNRLILINLSNTEILKEYKFVDSKSYALGRLLYQGQELMYQSGRINTNFTFFFARSPISNIDQLQQVEEDTPVFSPITSAYQVSSTASTPSISPTTKNLIISTSSPISPNEITSTTSPSITTHVALWNTDHVQFVQSNTSVQLYFAWACSKAVNYTTIKFSLAQTGSSVIPEWVQLEPKKREMHLRDIPKLEQKTTFNFSLQIAFGSEVYYKKFEIIVEECIIKNCDVCKLGNSSLCETCSSGYQGSNGNQTCIKIPAIAGTTEATTILIASSVVFASASSILSLSSVNSIFSIMNSLQLAILLPMIPDYFSPKVLAFLNEMRFTVLSFDFIKFKDIPFVEALSDWVSYPQSNEYLNSLGMRSGSSVINYLSLLVIIMLVCVIHLGVLLCNKCAKRSKNKKFQRFSRKLFKFFTFNIYIRIFMQAFVFTTLSIFAELYGLNLATTVTKISFGLCVVFCICTSVLFILSFYMYYRSFPQINKAKYWPCFEYFNGIKPTTFSKLYSSLFMLTRLLLTSFLIFGQSIRSYEKSIYFYLLNIAYGIYLIIVRPFESSQDNLIEGINQTLFCCLTVPLSWLNTEQAWTPFYEKFYTTIFVASSAIGSIICFGFLIKSIIVYIYKRKMKKAQQKIAPKEPSQHQRVTYIQELQNYRHHQSLIQPSLSMSRSNAPIFPHQAPKTPGTEYCTLTELPCGGN
ncbi:unnamed protein product [Moneuplotes crassus]|uniref:Transmembrane protein n=1 Tax=Euplotes crassus TaxID=5936 RepID=A0AAD1XYC4_EUPCR|nr:unnamed protein product [Moneuplotes crassus]